NFAVAALDQGAVLPGHLHLDRVVQGPLVAGDVQNVAIALGRDHPDLGAVVLEQGVGGDGGPVRQEFDLAAAVPESLYETLRGVVGSARNLVDAHVLGVGIDHDHVGEGAAHVDAG